MASGTYGECNPADPKTRPTPDGPNKPGNTWTGGRGVVKYYMFCLTCI